MDECAQLHCRLLAQEARGSLSFAERETAQEAMRLKGQILQEIGLCRCCVTCAADLPPPAGRWAGGACCAHAPGVLFTDVELAMLRAAGVGAEALEGPFEASAGCPFRSENGCTLASAARPNPCVAYMCDSLREELRSRGVLESVDRLGRRLEEVATGFARARGMRRIASDLLEALDEPAGRPRKRSIPDA